ncbi:hypothetical protein NFI99_12640 (plasmid) [Burkholderia glumae]|uniref:Uncharacterized protein n=1 Tax=Burkholderia glumae TaxID=337 RepID=A0ABY5BAU3_BURGL|nr:hypothetical protein [Burkholderia glumae]USS44133.1 hypothetical protein NFI99_12640 [Burkholderia glumae]
MTQKTYVYKNANGKWVPGFTSRQSAIDAAFADGLTQFETASVTTEPPAYFVRFLAPTALQKMIDGMRDGEESGHVVNSREAREALEKVAAAKISDGFPGDEKTDPSDWNKVIDLMNRMQDAAAAWFVENGLGSATVGFVDYGSTEFHVKGTSLNVPLL